VVVAVAAPLLVALDLQAAEVETDWLLSLPGNFG
jgi:hypothetical protein